MDIVNFFVDNYYATEQDERTVDYLIVKHEWLIYAMFASYLYFVLRCGPRYMENRRPYNLKTFIKYYNIFQIIYNGWIVYGCIKNGMFTTIGMGCEFVDKSPDGTAMALLNVFYWTLMLKIIDLIETAVFILRKKYRQVSFLHVYHHISTIYIAHISIKYFPGGMATVPVIVNSTVHVIMYTYYFLSSQGPKVQQIINPFKPYITILQMAQFFLLLAHSISAFLPHCDVPKWGALIMFTNLVINFILFYNFYRQNYKSKPKAKAK